MNPAHDRLRAITITAGAHTVSMPADAATELLAACRLARGKTLRYTLDTGCVLMLDVGGVTLAAAQLAHQLEGDSA